ncbi:patatin-like phospholipase domain-containing protein 4 isoform X4 [Balaenoptera acutorostrata]|uniref:Patatin-like phospholipase domain-containing protein 4 isoform X4 n=1 Tax=Balaenoptera acutorostrata TaxID=9767 RepID=A0A383ZGM5_BALAC|nr:patatin-like phospholipase domain-containing protein 4 isoform X4 [Balaenoptera acutorostrata]
MFYTEVPQACIARMKHINLSFAACGFLGIYHLGAASALCKHGKKLLKNVKAFAGASAGSLVASVLLTAPQKIEECNEFTYSFAEEIRRQTLGAVTPGYDFMARLRSGVEAILPPNAHELAHDRLHVSITNTETRENYLVSSFPSREDLIKVLLASSFVPVYAGLKPVEYKGQVLMRGVLSTEVGRRRLYQQPAPPARRPDSDHLTVQRANGHLPAGQRAAGFLCDHHQAGHTAECPQVSSMLSQMAYSAMRKKKRLILISTCQKLMSGIPWWHSG